MTSLEFRAAAVEDARQIASVIQDVYEAFAAEFTPTALTWDATMIADTHTDWLLAKQEGHVIGVVHHLTDPEGYTLDALAVLAPHRRSGVGSHLVTEVEQCAARTEATQMIIALRTSLVDTVGFFRARGYRPVRQHTSEHNVFTKPLRSTP